MASSNFIEIISPQASNLTEGQQESYNEWIKTLTKDIQVVETCAILNDLINLDSQISKTN